MKIYTKTGDKGKTSLFNGQRVDKDDARVEAYGTIDELSSHIGVAANFIEEKELKDILLKIQCHLFFLAGELANPEPEKIKEKITKDDILYLENKLDALMKKIPQVDAFIIPGTGKASAFLHVARTVYRRAERRVISLAKHEPVREEAVKFVNRLSDLLYTIARFKEEELIYMNSQKKC